MKKFLYIIFLSCCFFFGLQWLFQNYMDKIGRSCASQMKFVQQEHIDADLLISGNSRAQLSYNTIIMDSILGIKCCNLGLNGKPFSYQYKFMIEPYLKKNKKPSIIIQEVSPYAFLHHWNSIFDYNFLPFIGVAEEYDYYIQVCEEVKPYDKYLPFKYRGLRLNKLSKLYNKWSADTIRMYYDGYTPLPDSIKYVKYIPEGNYPFEKDSDILDMLSYFIHYCDTSDIQLFLVISPMHTEDFYNHCKMDSLYMLIDSLKQGTQTVFLNYSGMFGNDTIMMKDPTHMSYTGSCLFSEKVANEIKSYYNSHSY